MRMPPPHSYRVLIVDDEPVDWATPMKEALNRIAIGRDALGSLNIDIAEDKNEAEALLSRYNYHLTSLDMRLPVRKGELLSVDPGLSLARGFPWVGFPKLLIYSQTLRTGAFRDQPADSMMVLQIPTDLYAKPTGGDADDESQPVECLSVKAWAERVADSLFRDDLKDQQSGSHDQRLTVLGAYLHYGVSAVPPFLASHLQILSNHWTDRTSDRVEAAIGFIEATVRLALAQSALLCQVQGDDASLPGDDRMFSCLEYLETMRRRLSGWNWCNYLTAETIHAFQQARHLRNVKAHSLESQDPQGRWAGFRSPLRHAMDLAAYWVRHPLAVDLRFSRRDGWSAELLAGTANPRPRHPLPQDTYFPADAVGSGVWQNVWSVPADGTGKAERRAIAWENWLIPDTHTGMHWWFPVSQQGRNKTCIDLISGCKRILS